MKSIYRHLLFFLSFTLPLARPAFAQTWVSSGLSGGGTQTCVAIQPVSFVYGGSNGYPVILSAADTNGIARSTDYGKSWAGATMGANPNGVPYVASVMWDNINNQIAYAATVNGLYESTDAGLNWFMENPTDGGTPLFTFNSNATGGTPGDPSVALPRWPRSIGNLLAITPVSGSQRYLYAGASTVPAAGSGIAPVGSVWRGTDSSGHGTDGAWGNWTPITPASDGTPADPVNGVALNPNHAYELFVATAGNGVFYTSDAGSATSTSGWQWITSDASNPPLFAQGLLILPSGSGNYTLYVTGSTDEPGAATDGNGGVWSALSTDGYTDFAPLPGTGQVTDGSILSANTGWGALAGSYTDGNTVLFVGADFPQTDGSGYYTSIVQGISTDGTHWSWTSVAPESQISNLIYDTDGQPWWLGTTDGNANWVLGGSQGGVSYLQLDPNFGPQTATRLFAAQRSGAYSAAITYSGSAPTVGTWYPDVGGYTDAPAGGGMGVKDVHGLAVDPLQPGYLYLGTPDWSFFYSTDSGATFGHNPPPDTANAPGSPSTDGLIPSGGPLYTGNECKVVCVDAQTSAVFTTTVSEGAGEGNVWFWQSKNPVPRTGFNWTDSGLGVACYDVNQITDSSGSPPQYSHETGDDVQGMVIGRLSSGTWTTTDGLVCLAVAAAAPDGKSSTSGIWYGISTDGTGDLFTWTEPTDGRNSIVPYPGCVVPIVWRIDDPNVYAYEQQTGIYRSTDSGKVWSSLVPLTDGSPLPTSGFMVEDSGNTTDGDVLFFSTAVSSDGNGVVTYKGGPLTDGVYRLTQANGSTNPTPFALLTDGGSGTPLPPGTSPGPLIFSNGNLYCSVVVTGTTTDGGPVAATGSIYECTNPYTATAGTAIWTDVSDSVVYPGQAGGAFSAAMGTDTNDHTIIYVGSPQGLVMRTTD